MRPEDWPRVAEIYRQGIATGVATFEMEVPSWEEWNAGHLSACRLVADADAAGVDENRGSSVIGWAALSPVSDRCAYDGVAEVSLYVDAEARGGGTGEALLHALVEASEREGLWTLQAGILPENGSSLRIHHKAGFRVVGRRERLGKLGGRWRDVLMLERRSSVVGVE